MAVDVIAVLLGPDLEVELQLRWAARLAEARKSDLVILTHVQNRDGKTVEVPLDELPETEGGSLIHDVLQMIEADPRLRAGGRENGPTEAGPESEHLIHVRLRQIRCSDTTPTRKLLLDEVIANKIKLLTVARTELNTADADLQRERRLFLRYAPCEVVFCYGLDNENSMARMLAAAANGSHSAAALRLGRDLAAESDGTLTVVRVNPSIGEDAAGVGARRLDTLIKRALGAGQEEMNRRVVVADQIDGGLRRVWNEGKYDLILVGASRLGLVGSQLHGGIGAKLRKGEPKPAVAIVSAGSAIKNRSLGMIENFVQRVVPQMDREDRISLVDRVQSSSNWDVDFVVLMVLSTVIAAIGLIQNSAAVVIGAMLVAPLMTPLLGIGLALVQGNPVLARISFRAVGMGLGVSFLVALVVGMVTIGFNEPTREMLGRGGPSLLDLFVAFASGLAAAYAMSRPGLLAALPGVAIAAALVPPIATSGLALSIGSFDLAINALLLFVINMVTIVLASVASLWAVGIRNIKRVSRWTMAAGSVVLVSVMALGVYLSIKPKLIPAAIEVPAGLVTTIQQNLGDDYRLDSLAVAYDELGTQLNVRVSGRTLATEELANTIRAAALKAIQQPVRVRLVTKIESDPHAAGSGSGENAPAAPP